MVSNRNQSASSGSKSITNDDNNSSKALHHHCCHHHDSGSNHCCKEKDNWTEEEEEHEIKFRPGASRGIWLVLLFPVAAIAAAMLDSSRYYAASPLMLLAIQSCLYCFYLERRTVSSQNLKLKGQQPNEFPSKPLEKDRQSAEYTNNNGASSPPSMDTRLSKQRSGSDSTETPFSAYKRTSNSVGGPVSEFQDRAEFVTADTDSTGASSLSQESDPNSKQQQKKTSNASSSGASPPVHGKSLWILPRTSKRINNFSIVIVGIVVTALLLYFFTASGLVAGVLVSVVSVVVQSVVTRWLRDHHLSTFSMGEWLLAGELAAVSVSYSAYGLLSGCPAAAPYTYCQLSSFLQLSTLLSSLLLVLLFSLSSPSLFTITPVLWAVAAVGVLWGSLILGEFVPVWLLKELTGSQGGRGGGGGSTTRPLLLCWWAACSVVACISTRVVHKYRRCSVSTVRKFHHLVAVLVFVAGVLADPSFLKLATVAATIFCLLLEALRVLNVSPISSIVTTAFSSFLDEKDRAGSLILSPVYLLLGLSVPLWLHYGSENIAVKTFSTGSAFGADTIGNNRIDSVTDSFSDDPEWITQSCPSSSGSNSNLDCVCVNGVSTLIMLSGVLSVGIGDSFASVCGIRYGKHKWPGTKKTVEGTVCGILAQLIVVLMLLLFGAVQSAGLWWWCGVIGSMLFCGLVEAFTNQVDNLALPLLLFTGLSLTEYVVA